MCIRDRCWFMDTSTSAWLATFMLTSADCHRNCTIVITLVAMRCVVTVSSQQVVFAWRLVRTNVASLMYCDIIILIIIQHVYSAMGSYWDTEAQSSSSMPLPSMILPDNTTHLDHCLCFIQRFFTVAFSFVVYQWFSWTFSSLYFTQ